MSRQEDDLLDEFFRLALVRAQARRMEGTSKRGQRRKTSVRTRFGSAGKAGQKYQDPQNVTDVLKSFLAEKGWAEEIAASQVLLDWKQLLGSPLGDNCRPVSLIDGVLTVSARNSSWASDLRWYRNKFVELINERLAADVVQDVRIRVDGDNPDPDFRIRMRHQ